MLRVRKPQGSNYIFGQKEWVRMEQMRISVNQLWRCKDVEPYIQKKLQFAHYLSQFQRQSQITYVVTSGESLICCIIAVIPSTKSVQQTACLHCCYTGRELMLSVQWRMYFQNNTDSKDTQSIISPPKFRRILEKEIELGVMCSRHAYINM